MRASKPTSIHDLPAIIEDIIAGCLNFQSMLAMRNVSRRWREIVMCDAAPIHPIRRQFMVIWDALPKDNLAEYKKPAPAPPRINPALAVHEMPEGWEVKYARSCGTLYFSNKTHRITTLDEPGSASRSSWGLSKEQQFSINQILVLPRSPKLDDVAAVAEGSLRGRKMKRAPEYGIEEWFTRKNQARLYARLYQRIDAMLADGRAAATWPEDFRMWMQEWPRHTASAGGAWVGLRLAIYRDNPMIDMVPMMEANNIQMSGIYMWGFFLKGPYAGRMSVGPVDVDHALTSWVEGVRRAALLLDRLARRHDLVLDYGLMVGWKKNKLLLNVRRELVDMDAETDMLLVGEVIPTWDSLRHGAHC